MHDDASAFSDLEANHFEPRLERCPNGAQQVSLFEADDELVLAEPLTDFGLPDIVDYQPGPSAPRWLALRASALTTIVNWSVRTSSAPP